LFSCYWFFISTPQKSCRYRRWSVLYAYRLCTCHRCQESRPRFRSRSCLRPYCNRSKLPIFETYMSQVFVFMPTKLRKLWE